jgi:hypothetical protein
MMMTKSGDHVRDKINDCTWLDWLDREFAWIQHTAWNFMQGPHYCPAEDNRRRALLAGGHACFPDAAMFRLVTGPASTYPNAFGRISVSMGCADQITRLPGTRPRTASLHVLGPLRGRLRLAEGRHAGGEHPHFLHKPESDPLVESAKVAERKL